MSQSTQPSQAHYGHGHGHGHGHEVFILATVTGHGSRGSIYLSRIHGHGHGHGVFILATSSKGLSGIGQINDFLATVRHW